MTADMILLPDTAPKSDRGHPDTTYMVGEALIYALEVRLLFVP